MENRLEKSLAVPMSLCEHTSRMSIAGIISLFMDMATEHGTHMGLGLDELSEKGLMWLAIRTKIRIFERPRLQDVIHVATWPEAPVRIRCHRYYTAVQEEQVLIDGKNEWVMMDTAAGRPCRLKGVYPVEMEHCPEVVCEEPFFPIHEDFSDCAETRKYTVVSTDIDVSRHMNNVAYIRAAFGLFSCEALEHMPIREVEVLYRVQCYEGEELSLRMRQEENVYEIGIVKPDGKTAAVVRIVCG